MRETAKPSNEMPLTSLSPAPVPATAPAATAATSAAAAALAAAAAATATAAAASTAAGLSAGAHRELRVRRQPLCAAEGGSLAMEPRDSSRLIVHDFPFHDMEADMRQAFSAKCVLAFTKHHAQAVEVLLWRPRRCPSHPCGRP